VHKDLVSQNVQICTVLVLTDLFTPHSAVIPQSDVTRTSPNIIGVRLDQGLQITARGPNPAREDISSGSRRHFVNIEKILYLQKMH